MESLHCLSLVLITRAFKIYIGSLLLIAFFDFTLVIVLGRMAYCLAAKSELTNLSFLAAQTGITAGLF